MEGDFVEDLITAIPLVIAVAEAIESFSRTSAPGRAHALTDAADAGARLEAAAHRIRAWPQPLAEAGSGVAAAAEALARALPALAPPGGDVRAVFHALRAVAAAKADLYPLVGGVAPVSRWFLEPDARSDLALGDALARGAAAGVGGVFTLPGPASGGRDGAGYAPETYDKDRAWPLVVALHGGAGDGGRFLWSWVRAARSRGAIVLCPSSIGETWSISGPDLDGPALIDLVARARALWRIDDRRMLLTGMSDGGTYAYVSGLEPASPFTHLAPFAAAYHPALSGAADPGRLAAAHIRIAHGARDWMFPAADARDAAEAFARRGAQVAYAESPDVSHVYPEEASREILDWLLGASGTASAGGAT